MRVEAKRGGLAPVLAIKIAPEQFRAWEKMMRQKNIISAYAVTVRNLK